MCASLTLLEPNSMKQNTTKKNIVSNNNIISEEDKINVQNPKYMRPEHEKNEKKNNVEEGESE